MLEFQYSLWWLLPIVLLSGFLAGVLYFWRPQFSGGRRWLLFTLRFIALCLLGILLLQPLLKLERELSQEPIMLWLEDYSQSRKLKEQGEALQVFEDKQGPQLKARLAQQYQVDSWYFGGELKSDSTLVDGRRSNLAGALDNLQGVYFRQAVAGVILISDGIYNQGSDPQYLTQNYPFPIYSLIFGDTVPHRDLRISAVEHNPVNYRGARFPVAVKLRAKGLAGEKSVLRLRDEKGKLLAQESIAIDADDFFQRVALQIMAPSLGLHRYTLSLDALEGEHNQKNNRYQFSVETLESETKVLLWAQGLHPDLGALKQAIEADQNYRVETQIAGQLPPAMEEEATVLILHQPSKEMLRSAWASGRAILVLAGPDTDLEFFDPSQGFQLAQRRGVEQLQAFFNPAFSYFQLEEEIRTALQDWPPLQSPYALLKAAPGGQALFYKQLGGLETNDPLLVLGETDEKRYGLLLGVGLWRWRLQAHRQDGDFDRFDNLWQQVVKYLQTADRRERLTVEAATQYPAGDEISITARLLNASNELINDPELTLVLRNEADREFRYTFQRREEHYDLRIAALPEGLYRWTAKTSLDGQSFQKKGSFSVEAMQWESRDLQARAALLRTLSQQTGGKAFPIDRSKALEAYLTEKEQMPRQRYFETIFQSILNTWPLFFLFLILMVLEWGLRKYWGNY